MCKGMEFWSYALYFEEVTLTLRFLWTLVCQMYRCHSSQFVLVDNPWRVDVHGHRILVLWPTDHRSWWVVITSTLTLGLLWMFPWLRYWCCSGQFVLVDYPLGENVHGNGILVLWPLILSIWPWPWDCCLCSYVQGIDATMASLYLWSTHEA